MAAAKKQESVVQTKSEIKWEKFRTDFFMENMKEGRIGNFTLAQLAGKHGLAYVTVRKVAAKEDWLGQLSDLKKKVKEESEHDIKTLRVASEVEVRIRQSQYAKLLQAKAMDKIKSIDPSKMTIREALYAFQIGAIEERKALGLENTFQAPPDEIEHKPEVANAVSVALNIINQIKAIKLIQQEDAKVST